LFLLVSSGVLCAIVMTWRPDVAFYFLPTRGWELAIGSLGVFLLKYQQTEIWARRFFWPSLTILLALPVFPLSNTHPGIDAWLVCCATLIVILAGHPWLNRGSVVGLLARVGDWSYSLYLVHWPIIALASNVWVGDLPTWAKWAGVVLSIGLAWLQYRFIENPIRNARIEPTWPRATAIAFGSAALMLVPFVFLRSSFAQQEYVDIRRGNTGLSPACAFNIQFQSSDECQTAPEPKLLVWGDSYAMHLVPGIKKEIGPVGLVQATKYVCGPLIGVSPIAQFTGATQNLNWAKGCIDFNDSVLEYLKKTPSIETVVLSSVFKQYMTTADFRNLVRTDVGLREETGNSDAALLGLGRTVKAVRDLGKKVVVIAPPPAMDWDAGRCAERLLRSMPSLGPDSDCVTKDSDYQSKRNNVITFLNKLPSQLGVEVISFDEILRSGSGYIPTIDGEILFITNGHISYRGAEILANKMRLGEKIINLAK
jgi:hypothetical protein